VNQDATRYDKNMRPLETGGEPLRWHAVNAAPFSLEGFPFYEKDKVYRRLPVTPPEPLPEAVHYLANNTAGGQLRFRSDSGQLAIRVSVPGFGMMVHMAGTGQNGFDLYIGEPTRERFCNCAKYELKDKGYEVLLVDHPDRAMREYTLNFPLYNGVKEVLVGLDPDAEVEPPGPRAIPGRAVVYGTSITQGGCASRPGTCYTNILARRLNVEFVNLGFSGSGQGEPEVARALAQVEDPCLLVMDYEANCNDPDRLRRTLPDFVRIVRERHPGLPVLVVTRINHAKEAFDGEFLDAARVRREIQSSYVEKCRAAGDANVHFFDASGVLGEDFDECTVDGSHPTDLGFMRMARGFEPVYRRILGV
jgi:GDSL-like Lipase/Acylhydrolase family/N-terminus of Esterase_SGNH_hydro-type